jgi:hypothetical protein
VSTDWQSEVLPVLEAVYAATREHERPELGVETKHVNEQLGRTTHDRATALALDHLINAGYLAEGLPRSDIRPGPSSVVLTEKALQRVAGWPAGPGDAMLASLVAELDRRIATAGGDERSTLERFRDFAVGAGHDVLVAVLAGMADRTARDVL